MWYRWRIFFSRKHKERFGGFYLACATFFSNLHLSALEKALKVTRIFFKCFLFTNLAFGALLGHCSVNPEWGNWKSKTWYSKMGLASSWSLLLENWSAITSSVWVRQLVVGLNPFLQIPMKWSLLIASFQHKLRDYSLYLTKGLSKLCFSSILFSSTIHSSLVNIAVFCTSKPGDRHRQAAITLNSHSEIQFLKLCNAFWRWKNYHALFKSSM